MIYTFRCRTPDDQGAKSYGLAVEADSPEGAREILRQNLSKRPEDAEVMPPFSEWEITEEGEPSASALPPTTTEYACHCRKADDRGQQSYGMRLQAESVEQARELLARYGTHIPTHWDDGTEMPTPDKWHIAPAGEVFDGILDDYRSAEYQPTVGGKVSSYTPPAQM